MTAAKRLEEASIISVVAKCADVCEADLVGPYRDRWLVIPRSAAAFIMHRHGFSYPAIGRTLGGRHHTSIMYLVKRWPHYASENQALVKKLMAENILTADPAF